MQGYRIKSFVTEILTVKYLYPNTLMTLAPIPTTSAPPAPMYMLHTDPTATPPARVEFWIWTISSRPLCLLTADDRKKVVIC